jgi:hypothetical protein
MQIPRPNEGLGMTSEKVSFALCTLPFGFCPLAFAIWLLPFAIAIGSSTVERVTTAK